MNDRAAMYARVSTARQEREQTIASQIEALDRAAAAKGLQIAPEWRYVDEGFSGSRLDRPGLDALRDAAADGAIDLVFVYCPDRLARNYVYQQVVVEELEKRGVEVHFVERPLGERAEDRLLLQMQGVIAEYERAKIIERTRRGKLHKVRSGQMLPFAIAPYGYAIVRTPQTPQGVVVVEEVEAQHVREMYRWVIEEGLSVWQVTKRMNALGVAPRKKKFWVQPSVYRILTNSIYIGKAFFGKREFVEPKRPRHPGTYRKCEKSSSRARPRSQWIEVRMPPIIEERTQDAARQRFARAKRFAARNTQNEYLLRSMVICGGCGMRMQAVHASSDANHRYEYFYYACGSRDRIITGREQRCTMRRVDARVVDAVVWQAIIGWVQDPQILIREVEAWRSTRPRSSDVARARMKLQKLRRQLDLQVERLIDAYQQGGLKVDELKARRERLEASREAARSQEQQLTAEQFDRDRVDRLTTDLEAFASTLRAGLSDLDFGGRQRVVRLLIERVVIHENDLEIEHIIPLTGRFGQMGSRP
jgi:site-specific DNA recombinase